MSDIFRDFDKKNEISKVKIPKFDTGGICNDAICTKLDVFSQIDEIVKNIRDRQDNAMAMEFTKCIGELLKNNGVTPKITEYTRNFETDKTFEIRHGVSIDELDFSEHDKVFEDKIAEQKNEISMLKSLIDNYRDAESKLFDENKELKQRIAELEDKIGDRDEINRCLREQIAELESKKTEKPTKYITVIVAKEINGQEYVRLEDFMSVVNDLQAEIGT